MLKNLRIENFRCFKSFELKELGQLNLLVGKNNSGKTSILEAIQLLNSEHNLETWRELMLARSEYILNGENFDIRELDIRHLFYGHEIDIGSRFSIFSDSNDQEGINVLVDGKAQVQPFENLPRLSLIIDFLRRDKEGIVLPISVKEGVPLNYLRRLDNQHRRLQLVTSSSLTPGKMIELFDQVVLMPEEKMVLESLQIVEPDIERIASVGLDKYSSNSSRNGFVVKLFNSNKRIPIGSMGEGIWRMLGLALALVNARDGVLLVDDIDTGLHFTTMSDMWKLVWETAKRLNVQVFATTHSSDCWKSLDAIASEENPSKEGITIHRIEKGKSKSVVFTEQQVVIAAEDGIEVR